MRTRLITDPDLPDDPSMFGPPDPPLIQWTCENDHEWWSDLAEECCPECDTAMISHVPETCPGCRA